MNKSLFRLGMFIALALTGISIGYDILLTLRYVSFNSFPLPDVLMSIVTAMLAISARQFKRLLDGESPKQLPQNPASPKLHITTDLLKLTGASEEERENIAGDLLEEFNKFDSRLIAHIWLCRQVFKSALPLIYKTLKGRLASYFGERVR